jgi:hypothetical protein
MIRQKKAIKFKRGLEPLYNQSANITQKKERQVIATAGQLSKHNLS